MPVLGGASSGGAAAPVVTSVAYSATVTPDAGTAILNVGTLTGNVTLANPTGTPADGQTLKFRLAQDATGGRAVAFGTAYAFGTDITTAALPVAPSAAYELACAWHAGTSKWRVVGLVRGF